MNKEYFTYQTIRRDCINGLMSEPFLADEELVLFDTIQEAWEAAGKAAEAEAEALNGAYKAEDISFGVSEGMYEHQRMGMMVVVEGYFYDTTWMTKRVIRKVVKQLSPDMYKNRAKENICHFVERR